MGVDSLCDKLSLARLHEVVVVLVVDRGGSAGCVAIVVVVVMVVMVVVVVDVLVWRRARGDGGEGGAKRLQIRNLRKKCRRMQRTRAPQVPFEGLLWPSRGELRQGFPAGPRNEAMVDS